MSRAISDRILGLAGLALGAIALLISLNGDAWAARAAAALAKNSVKSTHIANGAVRTADIATGGVRSADIKNGTIGLLDLSPAVRSMLGRTGPVGATGAAGAPGLVGPPGPAAPGLTDGSITTGLLADGAVTSAKVAADTLTAADLATNAVGSVEIQTSAVTDVKIGAGAVRSSEVQDASLTADDIGKTSGFFAIDFPPLDPAECLTGGFFSGATLNGDVILVTPDANWPSGVMFIARPATDDIAINACNVTAAAINPPSTNWHYVVLEA